MANLTVFDPFREMMSLRNVMDEVFDNAMFRQTGRGADDYLALDMVQTDNDVTVMANLPGIKPEDISISVAGDILTIRGEVKTEKVDNNATYHLHERRQGSYSRSVQLPVPVVADKAKAEFEHGILKLTLPKAEEIKPKQITVKVK